MPQDEITADDVAALDAEGGEIGRWVLADPLQDLATALQVSKYAGFNAIPGERDSHDEWREMSGPRETKPSS